MIRGHHNSNSHGGANRAAALFLALLAFAPVACAQFTDPTQNVGTRPELLKDVGIDQKLNDRIPLGLVFRDESGKPVALSQLFGRSPVILTLVYYNCPMLCTPLLNALTRSLKEIPMDVGKQFTVVTVSIDPAESHVLASAKHDLYTGMYGRPGAAAGWHFLTGPPESINALTKAVGFQYQYDATKDQYAHATAIMVLTPQGRIARYFYGVDFPPKDLRLGLVEATQGKIGNPVDQVLLYCYHYDPAAGKYGAVVSNMLKVGGAVTIVLLVGLILILFRLDRAAQRRVYGSAKSGQAGLTQTRYVR